MIFKKKSFFIAVLFLLIIGLLPVLSISCIPYTCLLEGTKILIPSSEINKISKTINVENLKIGDEIISVDLENKDKFITNHIIAIRKKLVKKIYKITLENEAVILATKEHPIYEVNSSKYIEVKKLKVGHRLKLQKNQTIQIIKKEKIRYRKEKYVYDLSLKKEPHNYFANGVVVHNKTPPYYPSSSSIPPVYPISLQFTFSNQITNKALMVSLQENYSLYENTRADDSFALSPYYNYPKYYFFSNDAIVLNYQKSYSSSYLAYSNFYQKISNITFYDTNTNFIFRVTRPSHLDSLVDLELYSESNVSVRLNINNSLLTNTILGSTNESQE